MKKGNVFTFFPGKGVFTNPDSGLYPIISVYKKEDAERLFEDLSRALFLNKNNSRDAGVDVLFKKHGSIDFRRVNRKNLNQLVFSFPERFTVTDTRVSCSNIELEWDNIERKLIESGYVLVRRDIGPYMPALKKDIIYVYAVVHKKFGVVAEGKGF